MKNQKSDKIQWYGRFEEADKDTHNIVYAPSVQHIKEHQIDYPVTTTAAIGEDLEVRFKVNPDNRRQPYKPKNKTSGAFGGKR